MGEKRSAFNAKDQTKTINQKTKVIPSSEKHPQEQDEFS